MRHPFLLAALCPYLAAGTFAQELGSVNLPVSLAEAGVQVVGVLNRDPATNAYLGFCEGPAADADGNVFFSNNGRILKAAPDGKGSVFDASASGTNGLEFDAQGRLVSCQSGKIVRYPAAGPKETWISEGGNTALGSVNDLSIASTGAVLFTNFTDNHIFYRPASGGPVQNFAIGNKPNGIEWIEEKKMVYVNLTGKKKTVRFPFDPAAGTTLAAAAAQAVDIIPFVDGPDGLTFDALGNVYVAANQVGRIDVFDPQGASLGSITVKSANKAKSSVTYNTTNCVFGGPDRKTLFITGDAGAYQVRLKVAGRSRPGATRIAVPPGGLSGLRASTRARFHDAAGRFIAASPRRFSGAEGPATPVFPLVR